MTNVQTAKEVRATMFAAGSGNTPVSLSTGHTAQLRLFPFMTLGVDDSAIYALAVSRRGSKLGITLAEMRAKYGL